MNIVYAHDDNFAEPTGISIISLFENNRDVNEINVFILDNGISEDNKNRILDIAKKYSRKIDFLNMPNMEKIANVKFNVASRSIDTFSRLFVSSVLPKNVEKVIYMDGDTMIRGSLLPLWNADQNKNIVSGVSDPVILARRMCIFLKKDDIYINSGVLLINLKLWKEHNVETKLINFLKLMDGKLPCPDQSAINSCLRGYIGLLKPEYNFYMLRIPHRKGVFIWSPRLEKVYEKQEIVNAIENPIIVHLTSGDKRPWIEGNIHPFFQNEYMKYRAMTPWADLPLRLPTRGGGNRVKQIVKKALNMLPYFLYYKYIDFRIFLTYFTKHYIYSRKRLKVSEIKLEDCRIRYAGSLNKTGRK